MQNIERQIHADGTCVLTFDRPNSGANVFDRATLEELGAHLNVLSGTAPRGLILISAKPSIFIAGADLHAIGAMTAEELNAFIELGQNVFNQIAGLRIPTVAAMHGAALGGGYEIALACDWRIASPDRATKIGLPETKLGIVPAWGGSTRLPRLISVPRALDIILGGKTPPAKQALKLGMIDEVVPREHLLRAAKGWLAKGKRRHGLTHSAPVNAVVDTAIRPRARIAVSEKTHGHYPAVQKALDIVLKGSAERHPEASLARERAAIRELITLESTKNLISLFFLHERAKRLKFASGNAAHCSRAAVIGAGVMGAGIAQWLSARGLRVIMRDIDVQRVATGMAGISKLYADGVKHHVFNEHEAQAGLDRISPAATEVPLQRVEIVIEAAVEKMEVKKAIFRELDEQVREDALLTTNTSALSIMELAAATKHPARVIGIHFFNPVHRMQLVEVIHTAGNDPELVQRAIRFVQQIGKLPVLVRDSPGFLVNRILLPYMIEAGVLFTQGQGAEQIDAAMLDFGMPMGPLRLIDEVGVDISEDVARTLAAAFPQRMHVPDVLPAMIQAGLLGRKVGRGFYLHGRGRETAANPQAAALIPMPTGPALHSPELQRRLALLMVNEAARCLEERIAESAGDIDFAMVMGAGFAPFRGGPLRYADSLGARVVVDELSRLADTVGRHYAPSALLRELANSGKRFHED